MKSVRNEGPMRINSLSEGWAIARENVMRINICEHDLLGAIDAMDKQIIACSLDNVKDNAEDLLDFADDLSELADNIKSAADGICDFVDSSVRRRSRPVKRAQKTNGNEAGSDTTRQALKRTVRTHDEPVYDEDDGYDDVELTAEDLNEDLELLENSSHYDTEPEEHEDSYTDHEEDTDEQEEEPVRKQRPKRRTRNSKTVRDQM